MRRFIIALSCGAACTALVPSADAKPRAAVLTPQAIEQAAPRGAVARGHATGEADPAIVKAEVLLDRAGFSPGAIDGYDGDNFKKALAAYQAANGLEQSGRLDEATWSKLTAGADQPVLVAYEVTEADAAGPFVRKLPGRLEDMAKLPGLGYADAREELAERFHMSGDLIGRLNRGADLARPGTRIMVANVMPMRNPKPPEQKSATTGSVDAAHGARVATKVAVDKRERAVRAFDRDGALLAYFPASIGSAEKPAPSGSFKVTRVSYDPIYHYNPEFAFKGVKARHRFEVKPGPNNPVGLVWIDLSAPSYGIHGTPNPDAISKTQSHGCVRLTNWDALALAGMVRRGTVVEFGN